MRITPFSSMPAVTSVLGTLLAAACNPTNPSDLGGRLGSSRLVAVAPAVWVCHFRDDGTGVELTVSAPALAGHIAHGDYLTRLEVDPLGPTGDGIHFLRITDALGVARAARLAHNELQAANCRITISVAAGAIVGTTGTPPDATTEKFPVVIDVPDITLKGAFAMEVDADGRATGTSAGGSGTSLAPISPLLGGGTGPVSEMIVFINGQTNGSAGHRAVVEGFAFHSGRAPADVSIGGIAIGSLRVSDIVIRSNRFDNNLNSGVDLRASSGVVERIHLSGSANSCDVCLAGPGSYVFRDSRLVGGGTPGVLVLPAVVLTVPPGIEQYVPPASSHVNVVVENNEVRDHLKKPVGVGLRLGGIGVGAPNVVGNVTARFTNNTLANNTFGIIVEGAFVRNLPNQRADITLTTSGNVITGSCQHDLYVALPPSQVGLGLTTGLPLESSTYNLTLGSDLSWATAWYAHPDGFNNTLIVNGGVVSTGNNTAYDGTKVCP